MMWNIFLILVYSYLTFGLLDHIINVYKFFFNKDEIEQKDTKKKLTENK